MYYLLAFLIGIMLRLLGKEVVRRYVFSGLTDDELKGKLGFNTAVNLVLVGTILKYGAGAIILADLIKTYIL